MSQDLLTVIIDMLESTLQEMNHKDADIIVKSVIDILKAHQEVSE